MTRPTVSRRRHSSRPGPGSWPTEAHGEAGRAGLCAPRRC
uniref:Uncharacterized protein n=1 Tax=Myoviridae sp. ctEtC12 TaxID=2825062 RepID=A0A8S5V3F1_9CAUD|nr:MAG TPA: hypothetical protein [Myoviridae sp. ctEtC12]